MAGFAPFESPIGVLGVAWTEAGIVALLLPDPSVDATLRKTAERTGAARAAPPPDVRAALDRVGRMLGGDGDDLATVRLDLSRVAPFSRQVYELSRRVRPGETRTYGAIAKDLGKPGASRAVGQALGRNPVAIIVPCHRVLAASGAGGFSAPGGLDTKRRLLALERPI